MSDRRSRHARLRLLARVQRGFRVVTEPVTVGSLRWPFSRVANPDAVLEFVERQGGDAWQPYWVETWSSGVVLAEQLERRALRGCDVLDLGCGLGLVGAVAAARGARVVMVDAAPPALLFSRLNSWPWRRQVLTRRLDWRRDQLDRPPFGLIVGADILYERGEWEYLERFWRRHLADGGRVLLGEPGRRGGSEFPQWLADCGWHVTSAWSQDRTGQRVRVMTATRTSDSAAGRYN